MVQDAAIVMKIHVSFHIKEIFSYINFLIGMRDSDL